MVDKYIMMPTYPLALSIERRSNAVRDVLQRCRMSSVPQNGVSAGVFLEESYRSKKEK